MRHRPLRRSPSHWLPWRWLPWLRLPWLALVWLALGLSGCGLLDAATDVPFGAGAIPRIEQPLAWPDPDDLVESPDPAPTGYPESLDGATLAHLVGAMATAGRCQAITESDGNGVLTNLRTTMTACGLAGRCTSTCPADFEGLRVEIEADLELISAADAAKIKGRLASADASSIVQVRLRFFELGPYEGASDDPVRVSDRLSAFTFGLRDSSGGALDLVDLHHLADIRPETPRRFDLDRRSPLTKRLKEAVLSGDAVRLGLHLEVRVPSPSLYQMRLRPAGVLIDVQPELVISVLDVASSAL